MATIKSYTDIKQSKKLAKILPLESADMYYKPAAGFCTEPSEPMIGNIEYAHPRSIRCWSLAALLKCLSKIKQQVYTPILFPSEGKWILQFAEYGHGNVCEVSCNNPVDTCVEMIIKLKERDLI